MPNQGVTRFSGATLKSARLALGLSQAALGRSIGVRPGTIIAWETGRQRPTASRIAGLATALRTSPDAFLGEVDRLTLRELRHQAGLTGASTAALAGVAASWLYAVERGEQPLSVNLRGALAAAYLVTEHVVEDSYRRSVEEAMYGPDRVELAGSGRQV
jgi:transcriptional regulator with XRE-family HTH domain